MNYIQRVNKWRDEIPRGWDEEYTQLLSDNVAPKHAAAVVDYASGLVGDTERVTQDHIKDQYGISKNTIATHYRTITPDEYHHPRKPDAGEVNAPPPESET